MLKIAKLVSGEFVVGKYVDNYLSNIMLIHFSVNPKQGTVIKNLVPYMSPLSNSIGKLITNDKIIVVEDAPEDIQLQYLSMLQELIETIKRNQNGEINNGPDAISGSDKAETIKD